LLLHFRHHLKLTVLIYLLNANKLVKPTKSGNLFHTLISLQAKIIHCCTSVRIACMYASPVSNKKLKKKTKKFKKFNLTNPTKPQVLLT